jgi:hypothetical protein
MLKKQISGAEKNPQKITRKRAKTTTMKKTHCSKEKHTAIHKQRRGRQQNSEMLVKEDDENKP